LSEPTPSQPEAPRATRAVRGLVACVLVVSAIGAFAAWFSVHYAEKFAEQKRAKARADIELVLAALEAYRNANGDYPASLGALWVPDSRGFTYLDPKSPPKDPWNYGYQYARPGPGESKPRVWTFGRDKREGGDGESTDVKSWEEKR